jgi:hypothetical protein
MVDNLELYKWSSYPAFIGKSKAPSFLRTDWLLSQFHKSKHKAIKALKTFTLQEPTARDWTPEKEAYKGIILGSSEFVSKIQEDFLQGKTSKEIPKLKAVQKTLTSEEIMERVDTLKYNDKLKAKLKVYALKNYSPLTLRQIGERINNLHYSAISQIFIRLKKNLVNNKLLKEAINKVDELCKMSKIQT